MTTVIRWVLVCVLAGHGLIHLLGVAKGFGWSEISQLEEPIGRWAGSLWLLAAVLVLISAALLATGLPTWWWVAALLAAAVSQGVIATAWSDARAGSVVNVVLLIAAVYAFASTGPISFQDQWRSQATQALAVAESAPAVVTEQDLVGLPVPLAAYVRRSGAVERPRVTSFEASFHGRIRSDPTQDWMPFTGRQVNTFGPRPQRAFIMNATRSGLPVTVLHQFADGRATMRAKVLSLVPVVDSAGAKMDRGETVTVFNDLVVLAPGAIPGAPIRWTALDATHVKGVYSDSGQSVSAVLTFDANHDLVNFVSQDRLRASADGSSFVAEPWSTPIVSHQDLDGRRVLAEGEGRWDAPLPQGLFVYVEFHLDDIAHNISSLDTLSEHGVVVHRADGVPVWGPVTRARHEYSFWSVGVLPAAAISHAP